MDWTFAIALIFKGLDGLLEMVGGVLLLVVSRETLVGWVVAVTQHELSEDPRDFVSTHVLAGAQHLSGSSQTFAALYLALLTDPWVMCGRGDLVGSRRG